MPTNFPVSVVKEKTLKVRERKGRDLCIRRGYVKQILCLVRCIDCVERKVFCKNDD